MKIWSVVRGKRRHCGQVCHDRRFPRYAKCGDGHAGVMAGQSGVWVNGNIVKGGEERLLMQDQVIDVGSKDLQLLDEVFPLLRDE
jgi:hypothetical protein